MVFGKFMHDSYFAMETSYVARIYADSLRDNFVGYVPTDQAKFNAIRDDYDAEVQLVRPSLAAMLKTEAALVEVMPDDVIVGRFWAIYDRFRRVVPAPSCDRYDAWVPGRGDACWKNPDFVRSQTRTLLDAIHANYLVNTGREQSIKRLKIIIAIAGVVTFAILVTLSRFAGSGMWSGLLVLIGAGIFGAFLSLMNRMQNAVLADATLQDGIYELTGLRVGWVGVVMSLVMGGGFALVMYGIAMAGVLNVAVPLQATFKDPLISGSGSQQAPAGGAGSDKGSGVTASATPVPGASPTPVTSPSAQPTATASARTAPPSPVPTPTSTSAIVQNAPPILDNDVASPHCQMHYSCLKAKALGLTGGSEFFKMLLLAFLAGFAERLVPDILNRLTKQDS